MVGRSCSATHRYAISAATGFPAHELVPANGKRGAIAVFLLLTLSFSSIFYLLIAKSGHVGGGWGAYIGCLMWCPGVAALLTYKYLGRDLSSLGWNWGKTRYQVICYFLPLAYAIATHGFVWLTGLGGFYDKQFVESFSKDFGLGPMRPWVSIALYFLFTATITVVKDCATVLGEEIGWRGFLVSELAKRHSFTATAIISGFICALWHYPIFCLRTDTTAHQCGTTFRCLLCCCR